MIRSPLPARSCTAAALCGLFVFAVTASYAEAAATPRPAFVTCQSAYLDASFRLLQKRVGAILKCANGLLTCSLQEELAGSDFAACSAKLVGNCDRAFAKIVNNENAAAAKLAILCSPLTGDDFASVLGLGFSRFDPRCGTITNQAEATACFVSSMRCRAADIAEGLDARTYELFDRTGLLVSHPETTSCLDVRVDSPATPGSDLKALATCEKGLTKTYAKAFYKMPRVVSRCLGGLLECQLRADQGDAAVEQPPACFSSQENIIACDKALGEISATFGTALPGKAALTCDAVPVPDILAGLGLTSLCPGAATPYAVANCVRGLAIPAAFLAIDEAAPRTCQLSNETSLAVFEYGDFCAAP